MPYILKNIDEDMQKSIIQDASVDQRKSRMLKARGGYFENKVSPTIAFDNVKNHYLVIAPRSDYMSIARRYYFFFQEKLYEVGREAPSNKTILAYEWPDESQYDFFRKELAGAFKIYGFWGDGKEWDDNPNAPYEVVKNL